MMKKVAFLAALLLAPLTALAADPSADLSVTVVPPSQPPSGSSTPSQASAHGFSTLAFDGDMTKGFDVACDNDPASGDHQWYLGGYGVMWGSCNNLTYPHTDETDGSKVLQINLGPSSRNGGILARVGISTSDNLGTHAHHFPINAYYECVVRIDAYSIGHLPLWHNCWMVDWFGATTHVSSMEYDLTEFHGGYENYTEIAGNINWPSRSAQSTNWFGNLASKIPGFDPSKFHKYGMLMYQTSQTTLHIAGYVDDVLIHEGDAALTDDNEKKQRNYLVVDLTAACNWDEGSFYCTNQPVQKVFADGSGNLHVQTTNAVMTNTMKIGITGVKGVTSLPDGDYGFKQDNWNGGANGDFGCSGPCTLSILDKPFGNPMKMTGSYTGGGTINAWTDPGMRVYVKSFRVWSCANWATKQCSQFNNN